MFGKNYKAKILNFNQKQSKCSLYIAKAETVIYAKKEKTGTDKYKYTFTWIINTE